MPVPQGPRRAAPPRKKAASKPTSLIETGVAQLTLEDTTISDSPGAIPDSHAAPVPALSHIEPEMGTADANADGTPSEPADVKPTLPPGPISRSSDPRPESLDTPRVDSKPGQDLPPLGDTTEPSSPGLMQKGPEVEEVVTSEPGKDEIAEAATATAEEGEGEDDEAAYRRRAAERGATMEGVNPLGGQPMPSAPGVIPVEDAGGALEGRHAPMDTSAVPYSVSQLGGGTSAAGEEDEGDGKY
jgi:myosin tail region-interacting protein MTI1